MHVYGHFFYRFVLVCYECFIYNFTMLSIECVKDNVIINSSHMVFSFCKYGLLTFTTFTINIKTYFSGYFQKCIWSRLDWCGYLCIFLLLCIIVAVAVGYRLTLRSVCRPECETHLMFSSDKTTLYIRIYLRKICIRMASIYWNIRMVHIFFGPYQKYDAKLE